MEAAPKLAKKRKRVKKNLPTNIAHKEHWTFFPRAKCPSLHRILPLYVTISLGQNNPFCPALEYEDL
jgi:hypothetical protein